MKTQANLYIVRVLAQRVIGCLLFFFFARWVPGVRALVYFSLYFVFAIISLAMVRSISPSTLAARGKIGEDTPIWDKILLAFYWMLAYFVIYIIAGLEASSAPALGWLFGVGVLLQGCCRVADALGGSGQSVSGVHRTGAEGSLSGGLQLRTLQYHSSSDLCRDSHLVRRRVAGFWNDLYRDLCGHLFCNHHRTHRAGGSHVALRPQRLSGVCRQRKISADSLYLVDK